MNAKKKGNAGEHLLAHYLKDNGIPAWRNAMSGGTVWKGDIGNNIGLSIEVKTVKHLNLLKAWKQCLEDSDTGGGEPTLAIHFDNMGKNEWLMVIHSEHWLELIKKWKDIK